MTDSGTIRLATVASDSGKVDVGMYAEVAREGVVQCMTHDSAKCITYMSMSEARGRIFRLYHDTGRMELFSHLYDVKYIALVPIERRTDTDYIVVCREEDVVVYSIGGAPTTSLFKFENFGPARVGGIWCAFDAKFNVIVRHVSVRHSMEGPIVLGWNGERTSLTSSVLHIQDQFTLTGAGIDRWPDVKSVHHLTNMAYGGGDDDNIVLGMTYDPRTGVMLVCTPRAVWCQDTPTQSGSKTTCHMIYGATRDDTDDTTELADTRSNCIGISRPIDVVRKTKVPNATKRARADAHARKRAKRVSSVNGPRTRISCMTLEYDDGYSETLRTHLHALSETDVLSGMLHPLLDFIVAYAKPGTCILLADSGRRRLLRVPLRLA
jgi:hypothetical protein